MIAAGAARTPDATLDALAHDLRTPLNAMKMWADVLRHQRTTTDEVSLRAIEGILASIEQQARLIDELADLAHAAGENSLHKP